MTLYIIQMAPLNFYQIIEKKDKSLLKKSFNPYYGKTHHIKIPFRMLITGTSGSMKSNTLCNLIYTMSCFHSITIVCKNADEPLYQYLKKCIPDDQLTIIEGTDDIPELDNFDTDYNHLVVFDDMVTSKNQKPFEEFFIRARKRGVSVCYLTQSYYRVPKIIRCNVSHVILKKVFKKDLHLILSEYNIGMERDALERMYRETTDGEPTNFFMMDLEASPEEMFYKNFQLIK